jgi:hypothetical protein
LSNGKDEKVLVTVSSAYGNPNPRNGQTKLAKGPQTFSVTSPFIENRKTLGISWKKVWNCTGWSNGLGSIPAKGVGTSADFELAKDSSITWNWVPSYDRAQFFSIFVFALLIAIAVVAIYIRPHAGARAFIVAISAGAIGGLAHEITQSQGKFILPTTDETGNFCLGGLIGIIVGGTAGLTTYQGLLGTTPVTVSAKLVVAALLAGLAVKGVADSANPTQSQTSTSST